MITCLRYGSQPYFSDGRHPGGFPNGAHLQQSPSSTRFDASRKIIL